MKEKHLCCDHHTHDCSCQKDGCCIDPSENKDDDCSLMYGMFGLDDNVPDDVLSLLQLEINECDTLSELLGVGKNPDVDDILQEAIEGLSEKKKKTLMNLAIILHDYLPE